MKARLAAFALSLLALGACAQNGGPGPKQTIGGLGGAALGGFLGSHVGAGTGRLAATAAGAVLGGLVGSSIGGSLDRADRLHAAETTHGALEHNRTGETSRWRNPDSGHAGTVTPTETYRRDDGAYCREYQTTVTVGGRAERGYGTACRQPDGSWKIVGADARDGRGPDYAARAEPAPVYEDDLYEAPAYYETEVRVPPGHLPPPGACRIWYPDRPPGHQPPPGDCRTLRHRVPPQAVLVYG